MIMRSAMHLGVTTNIRSLSEADLRKSYVQRPLHARSRHWRLFKGSYISLPTRMAKLNT